MSDQFGLKLRQLSKLSKKPLKSADLVRLISRANAMSKINTPTDCIISDDEFREISALAIEHEAGYQSAKNMLYDRTKMSPNIALAVSRWVCDLGGIPLNINMDTILAQTDVFCEVIGLDDSDRGIRYAISERSIREKIKELNRFFGVYALIYADLDGEKKYNIFPLVIHSRGGASRYRYRTGAHIYTGVALSLGGNIALIGVSEFDTQHEIEAVILKKYFKNTRVLPGVASGISNEENPISTGCIAVKLSDKVLDIDQKKMDCIDRYFFRSHENSVSENVITVRGGGDSISLYKHISNAVPSAKRSTMSTINIQNHSNFGGLHSDVKEFIAAYNGFGDIDSYLLLSE